MRTGSRRRGTLLCACLLLVLAPSLAALPAAGGVLLAEGAGASKTPSIIAPAGVGQGQVGASASLAVDPLPVIERSHPADLNYLEQQRGLESWYRLLRQSDAEAAPLSPESLVLYRYFLEKEESVIAAAARFSLPYSTVATINRVVNSDTLQKGRALIIPAAKGLFVPLDNHNELETVLLASRPIGGGVDGAGVGAQSLPGGVQVISVPGGGGDPVLFAFYPGADFLPFERTAFFGRLFHNPVRTGRISSEYGERADPFTGVPRFHYGIDVAAKRGSAVVAARSGTIIAAGESDPIYGNFVRIAHEGGFTSLYAHLDQVHIRNQGRVSIGTRIGTVGSSGHSTGPHLHFEIHLNDRAVNPANYLYLDSVPLAATDSQ